MDKKTLRIGYWVSTLLFVLPLSWSAVQYLTEAPKMVATMTEHLGYPLYFIKILGIAKLLGAAALLYPGLQRLKEWAFAGFTFDLLGASVSHLSSGDSLGVALIPVAFLGVLSVAYFCWRRLGAEASMRPSERPRDFHLRPVH